MTDRRAAFQGSPADRRPTVSPEFQWLSGIYLALLLACALLAVAVRITERRRYRRLHPRPGQPLHPAEIYVAASRRLHGVESRWIDFEGNPVWVLSYPLIADPAAPTNVDFLDALEQARSLDPRAPRPRAGDREDCIRFAEAVGRVDEAWRTARDTARQVGLSRLDPAERTAVEQAIDLIKLADSHDHPDAEREAAGDRAREQVEQLSRAGVLRLTGLAEWSLQDEVGNLHPFPLTG
jgi:hypothetical protein